MFDISEIENNVRTITEQKTPDEKYITDIVIGHCSGEESVPLRIRDEIYKYHKSLWEQDIRLATNKIDALISDYLSEKEQIDSMIKNIASILKQLPKKIQDPESDGKPWTKKSKLSAALIILLLIIIVGLSFINFPSILIANSVFAQQNKIVTYLFCIVMTISVTGYKFAELYLDELKKYSRSTTTIAAIVAFSSILTAITALLLSSFGQQVNLATLGASASPVIGKGTLAIFTSASIILSEMSTAMLFAKSLAQIIKEHGKPDMDNPEYIDNRQALDLLFKRVSAYEKAVKLKSTINEVASIGLENYVQRADAELSKVFISLKAGVKS